MRYNLDDRINSVRDRDGNFMTLEPSDFRTRFDNVRETLAGKKGLILAAGGQAPGINDVVKSFVRLCPGSEFYGLNGGFPGIHKFKENVVRLVGSDRVDVNIDPNIINGQYKACDPQSDLNTLILSMGRGNGRMEDDVNAVASFLQQYGFDFVVTIGGDGTLKGTEFLDQCLRENQSDIQVLHMPKTVDGDLYGRTFGIISAADDIRDHVKNLTSEHRSNNQNPFIYVIETMGRNSGKLPLSVAAGTSQVDLVLVPELSITASDIIRRVDSVLKEKSGMNILLAEGVQAIPGVATLEDKGEMLDPLSDFLQIKYHNSGVKINRDPWSYAQRSVGKCVGEDERLIGGLCDTGLRALASGALGASVVDTNKTLDLTIKRPRVDKFEIDTDVFQTLLRQGYDPAQIEASFVVR